KELRFKNEPMNSKALKRIVHECFRLLGTDVTADTVDRIKKIGFEYGLLSGMSIAMRDITIPSSKESIIEETSAAVEQIQAQYNMGLITDEERRLQTIRQWEKARDEIGTAMKAEFDKNSPVFIAVDSGA